MDGASANGELDSLNWWLVESRLKLKYSLLAMDLASACGLIEILEWWYLQTKAGVLGENKCYSLTFLQAAVLAGDVAVLDWWEHQDIDVKLNLNCDYEYIFWVGMQHSQLAIVQWVASKFVPRSEYPMRTEVDDLSRGASRESYWRTLEWMHANEWLLNEENVYLVGAHDSIAGRIDALECWVRIWRNFDLDKRVPCQILLFKASHYGHITVLDWCVQTELFDPTDENHLLWLDDMAIDSAANYGHVHILDWWMRTVGRENVKYSWQAMHGASENGHVGVLQWFKMLDRSSSTTAASSWARPRSLGMCVCLNGGMRVVCP